MARYPKGPGYKDRTVSRDNAIYGKVRFNHMQALVYDLYSKGFVGTADDAADRLNESPFSIRPRCTELVAQGLLVRLRRDRSLPGRHAWVLGLAEPPDPGLADDGQPTETQEWQDYDPQC